MSWGCGGWVLGRDVQWGRAECGQECCDAGRATRDQAGGKWIRETLKAGGVVDITPQAKTHTHSQRTEYGLQT